MYGFTLACCKSRARDKRPGPKQHFHPNLVDDYVGAVDRHQLWSMCGTLSNCVVVVTELD
jgi:hypothetical protein